MLNIIKHNAPWNLCALKYIVNIFTYSLIFTHQWIRKHTVTNKMGNKIISVQASLDLMYYFMHKSIPRKFGKR